ncbi:MAG: prepilin-type N-terminal cleavage/methylation domain-containing protein [Acidovorax sp.]|uniref:PulJ/GspJ family protein n=1 Tax=Acidovorax sp. TaxID=1872122 RepID=UPI0026275887|nr:prepilin-type N-terminal cleavage/methylation domain-containing protein [Acidovorax sp.]MDH4466208.1 prepilin-type N-terminal cleavage/methylation domain-containing protein [Acidovorax sp.]
MSFACAVGRQPQRGLSLLELLVAFAILALSLGLLYRSMGASARSVADMGYQQQAALLAESLLASRDSVSVEGWNESGTREGFDFRVASAPYGQGLNRTMPAPAATTPGATVLHEVLITISWLDGTRRQSLEVRTLLPQRKPDPLEATR